MSCVSTANSSSKTNLIITVNQVLNKKNNISKNEVNNYNFLVKNLTNRSLSSPSSPLAGEEEEEIIIQEVNTNRAKMNDTKSNSTLASLTINEIATSLNDNNSVIESSQNELNNENEQLETKQPTIESLSNSFSNKQLNSNESINKRKKKTTSNINTNHNQQSNNLNTSDDEHTDENNECKNLEEEINDEELINTLDIDNNNINNTSSNHIHEFYSENINNNEQNSSNDQDFIICGSCQADFKLSSIIDFIDHKIQKCKSTNSIFLNKNSQKQLQQKSLTNNNSKRLFQSSNNKNRNLFSSKEAEWGHTNHDEVDTNEESKDDNNTTLGSSPYIYKCSTCGRLFKEVIRLVEHCEIEHNIQICKKFTKTGETSNSNLSNSSNNSETVDDLDSSSNENSRNTKINSFLSPVPQQRNKLNIQQSLQIKKQTTSNRLNIQGSLNNSSNRLNPTNNIQQLGNPNKKVKIIHHQHDQQDQHQSLDTTVGTKRFTNTIINKNQNNGLNNNKFKNITLLNGQPATIITNNGLSRSNINNNNIINNKNNAFNNNQNKTAINLLNKIKAVSSDSQIKREITDNNNLNIIKRNINKVGQNPIDEYDENNNESDDIDNQEDDINNDAIELDDPDENRADNLDNNNILNISTKSGIF